MAPRLSVVFRRLVRLGSFPPCWRQANVTPIPKGPPPSSVANYRPISMTSALSKPLRCLNAWCLFVLDDLWNAMVYFQPRSLLIGKVWVAVMHFRVCPIHCKVHMAVGRRLGSCRLISVQPLTGLTIRAFSIGSALWVLDVLCCPILTRFLSNRSQHVMVDGCLSKVDDVVSGVPQGSVPSIRFGAFFHSGK